MGQKYNLRNGQQLEMLYNPQPQLNSMQSPLLECHAHPAQLYAAPAHGLSAHSTSLTQISVQHGCVHTLLRPAD